MSRLSKYLLVFTLIVFTLACNFIAQPFNDAQNVVETAQSFATAMPLETLQSFATNMPVETLQALPSAMPDFGNMLNPQGEPVPEWNSIPVMPQATAGQEFNDTTYSFKVDAKLQEVTDYYNNQLTGLGWNQLFNMPGNADGAILVFSKDSNMLTITISSVDGATVVILTLV
jgi:hypothetical protein